MSRLPGSVTVAVSSPSFCKSDELLSELRALGVRVVANTAGTRFDEAGLAAYIAQAEAEVAIVGLEPVTRAVLDRCPRLKTLCKYGVGLDNVDQDALAAKGVRLGWTGGVNRRSVSELALCFMLGHARNVFKTHELMRKGTWEKNGGRLLSNTTVGIVGLGFVGEDLARLLAPLGCAVQFTDIVDKTGLARELGLKSVSYRELVATSDVISFHVPSTPLTRGMFGRAEVELARPRAPLVVNTARGDVVDFAAALEGLRSGALGGFATDVFPDEPYDARGVADLATLYTTPHIGGNAREAVLAMGRSAIAHVAQYVTQVTGAR